MQYALCTKITILIYKYSDFHHFALFQKTITDTILLIQKQKDTFVRFQCTFKEISVRLSARN